MFDEGGDFSLLLGTSKKILSSNILTDRNMPIYLVKPPFNNKHPLVDSFSIIAFLSAFDDEFFKFSQTKEKTEVIIDGKMFTNYIEIYRLSTKLFKIRYQKTGNFFAIQIINNHSIIKYREEDVILSKNRRNVLIFDNKPILSDNSDSPIQFKRNKAISELSDFYNNKSVDKNHHNQVTASLFYSIAPFTSKTISRQINLTFNPDDTIDGVFKSFGGKYFRFHSDEEISIDDFPFNIFCWFSPYFDHIIKTEEFAQMKTVELDATFSALAPYKICIPLLIYRNTGIPIGILASISESAALYSMFFESLKKLDSENPDNSFSYFEIFKEKKFLTDEHRAFKKLQKEYGIDIFHCIVHLIRSIGANSLLGFLLSDVLYQYTLNEWNENYERLYCTFKLLYDKRSDTADKSRFDKLSQIFGKDPEGNNVEINLSYSPIFKRISDNVPSTTNHIEAFHKNLNHVTKGLKNIALRLGCICKYIIDRTIRSNKSSEANLKLYLGRLKEKACNKIGPKYQIQKCDCGRKLYFERLYGISVPCIHDILQTDEKMILESLKVYDINFNYNEESVLEEYDIITNLKFKNSENNSDSTDNDQINKLVLIDQDDIGDDVIERIVTNTERQLHDVIEKYKIDLTVYSLKLYREMMGEQKEKNLEEPMFWASFQVRLWLSILKNRRKFSI